MEGIGDNGSRPSLAAEELIAPAAVPGRDRAVRSNPRPFPPSKSKQRGEDLAGVSAPDCAIENKRRAVPAEAGSEDDAVVGVGEHGEWDPHDTVGLARVDRADWRRRTPVGERAGHVKSRRWDVQARQHEQRLDAGSVHPGLFRRLAFAGAGGPVSPVSRAPHGNATSPAWSRTLSARWCSSTSGPASRSVAVRIRTAACRSAALSGTGSLQLSSSARAAGTAWTRRASVAGTDS